MKTAELRMIPVSELKPAEYNPRKKLKPGDKEYEKIFTEDQWKRYLKSARGREKRKRDKRMAERAISY